MWFLWLIGTPLGGLPSSLEAHQWSGFLGSSLEKPWMSWEKSFVGHSHGLTGWYQWSFRIIWPNSLRPSPAIKQNACYKLSSLPKKLSNNTTSQNKQTQFLTSHLPFRGDDPFAQPNRVPWQGFSYIFLPLQNDHIFGTTNTAWTWRHGRLCLFCVVDKQW